MSSWKLDFVSFVLVGNSGVNELPEVAESRQVLCRLTRAGAYLIFDKSMGQTLYFIFDKSRGIPDILHLTRAWAYLIFDV